VVTVQADTAAVSLLEAIEVGVVVMVVAVVMEEAMGVINTE
jgi:hypothetical protein